MFNWNSTHFKRGFGEGFAAPALIFAPLVIVIPFQSGVNASWKAVGNVMQKALNAEAKKHGKTGGAGIRKSEKRGSINKR